MCAFIICHSPELYFPFIIHRIHAYVFPRKRNVNIQQICMGHYVTMMRLSLGSLITKRRLHFLKTTTAFISMLRNHNLTINWPTVTLLSAFVCHIKLTCLFHHCFSFFDIYHIGRGHSCSCSAVVKSLWKWYFSALQNHM